MIGVGFCGSTMAVLRALLTEHQARLRSLKSARMISKCGENIIMRESLMGDLERFGNGSIVSTE
jgi:hypothetical protein